MIERAVYAAPPRRRLAPTKLVPPLVALAIAGVVVGEWACAPRAPVTGEASPTPVAAALMMAAPTQEPPAQPQPAPQQPALPPPSSLEQLDRQLASAMRPVVSEETIRDREARAAASAFPVTRTLELSSTMYCLKGEMRTGVRTRDGMAAGDPRVLPLGSVVRVSRPNGDPVGIFVIMDTGGAIRGNDIDLYVDSCAEARAWGRHPVVAEVLDIGKRL